MIYFVQIYECPHLLKLIYIDIIVENYFFLSGESKLWETIRSYCCSNDIDNKWHTLKLILGGNDKTVF